MVHEEFNQVGQNISSTINKMIDFARRNQNDAAVEMLYRAKALLEDAGSKMNAQIKLEK